MAFYSTYLDPRYWELVAIYGYEFSTDRRRTWSVQGRLPVTFDYLPLEEREEILGEELILF